MLQAVSDARKSLGCGELTLMATPEARVVNLRPQTVFLVLGITVVVGLDRMGCPAPHS